MHIATNIKKSSIPPLEPDTYQARCVQLIDIGDQLSQNGKCRREIMLVFELPTERIDVKLESGETENRPRIMSKRFGLSMYETSHLRKAVNSWRGKALTDEEAAAFDVSRLVGAPCMLSVVQKTTNAGKTYSFIDSITRFPKALPPLPEPETPMFAFDLDTVDDLNRVSELPKWVQKYIEESPTYKELLKKKEDLEFQNISADDLPFGND